MRHATTSSGTSGRRSRLPERFVPALVAAVVAATCGVLLAGAVGSPASACGPGGETLRLARGPVACVHLDEAPEGVDVTEHVSTEELLARPGAGPAAYAAAEELGVPTAVASNATSPSVTCDGDGTSGYRVQTMYVVEAGATNRYSSLLASFKLWAAGTDDVINRSAALTGGVRHIRYVTEASGGTCTAKVLNVVVPSGALSSFNGTISALQGLGYTDASRKYLLWTDASSLCGVATMYNDDRESQAELNNGSYAQYARVDSGCWGLGNGTSQHSVEAHELTHTLGGVQNSAPHSTKVGHCWDESDTMCYADGGAYAMRQVCPAEREYLLDCNTDDYFSTYPDPGSYLDTHWNAADSRFLIGGGTGSGGGTTGTPTTLGATISVNNPAVPGLPTQAGVTPALPTGRSVTSVTWTAGRKDCTFATPTALQSTVTCPATVSAATTVTATVVDSTGATKSVTSPLTFAAGTARPVSLAVTAAGQTPADGASASVCTGAAFPLAATVTDTATGLPVKGLSTSFTRRTATATTTSSAGSAPTGSDGVATVSPSTTTPLVYGAKTVTGAVYTAGTSNAVAVSPAQCSPVLTATTSSHAIYLGDAVTVAGTLTRDLDGEDVPVSGASLQVRFTASTTGRTTTVGSPRTAADGNWTVDVKPTVSGTLSVLLPGSASYVTTGVDLGSLTVTPPATTLTGAVDRTDVGYGSSVTVTGTLLRVAGGSTTGAAKKAVSIMLATPDRPTPLRVGHATTDADGRFVATFPLKASGTLSVSYAGSSLQPAATTGLGDVTVGSWSTSLSVEGSAASLPARGALTLTGALTRSYGDVTEGPKGVRLQVWFEPADGGPATLVSTRTTTTDGVFSARVVPRATGTWSVTLSTVAGYADAVSPSWVATVS